VGGEASVTHTLLEKRRLSRYNKNMSKFMVNLTAVNPKEDNDMSLLGVRTLEGFSVMVDNIGHRFVATVTLAC